MKLKQPIDRKNLSKKTNKKYECLLKLITALEEKELSDEFVNATNQDIDALNQFHDQDSTLRKKIRKTISSISGRALKMLKYSPRNHYRTQWLAIGMSAFGLPMGVAFSAALDNYGFIGIGLPIGMAIGMALGAGMDQKAQQEGRQLDLDLEL